MKNLILQSNKNGHFIRLDVKTNILNYTLTKDLLLSIYENKGLNALNGALKSVPHITKVIEFGLATNKKAVQAKADFLSEQLPYNTIRIHYYSIARGTRYRYNVLRAKEIRL